MVLPTLPVGFSLLLEAGQDWNIGIFQEYSGIVELLRLEKPSETLEPNHRQQGPGQP